MAYSEALADRSRRVLADLTDFDERHMFGGLAFMVNAHMACGVIGNDLMVRVGKRGHEDAIERGANEMLFTGRPMRGMVILPGDRLKTDATVKSWLTAAVKLAHSEPPKTPTKRPKYRHSTPGIRP
jgi:TfoX/Sxy family transcriptional regulator of competence genes